VLLVLDEPEQAATKNSIPKANSSGFQPIVIILKTGVSF